MNQNQPSVSTPQTTPPVNPQQPRPNQPQPVQPQPQAQPQKSNNKKLFIIVALAACLPLLAIVGILSAMVLVGLGSAREKAKDAKIKTDVQTLQTKAEVYYDKNQTYIGWQIDPIIQQDLQKYRSEAKVQGLTDKTYVIYAQEPDKSRAGIFCVDSSGYSSEVDILRTDANTCKP